MYNRVREQGYLVRTPEWNLALLAEIKNIGESYGQEAWLFLDQGTGLMCEYANARITEYTLEWHKEEPGDSWAWTKVFGEYFTLTAWRQLYTD